MIKAIQVLIGLLLGLSIYNILPRIEGQFFPVLYDITIASAEPDLVVPGATVVSGFFDKGRACDFKSLVWYFGKMESGSHIRVNAELLTEPAINSIGENYEFRVRVYLSPLQVNTNSFVQLQYNCYNGWLWDTIFRVDSSMAIGAGLGSDL